MHFLNQIEEDDLLDLMVEQKEVEVRCDYCNTAYMFGREELKTLYRKYHRSGKDEPKNDSETEENNQDISEQSEKTEGENSEA